MAIERKWEIVSPQLITSNGTTDGLITTDSASLFHVGQEVAISSSTAISAVYKVKRIEAPNRIFVGPKAGNINSRSDLSAILLADTPTIKACEQPRPNINIDEIGRATYQEEPAMAIRTIDVDSFGNLVDPLLQSTQIDQLTALNQICDKIANLDSGDIFIAGESISAVKLVRALSPTTVEYASNNTTYENARVLGMSTTAASATNTVEVKNYGKVTDSSFPWPVNTTLYLGINGEITDTAPLVGFHTEIGMSLGVGEIFLDINDPIML